MDTSAEDIRAYEKQRTREGAAPRSINIEVSLLRGVMGSLWARLKEDGDGRISLLPEPPSIGRKLSPGEEARLLTECLRSRSRVLYPLVVIALATGARKTTIRTLQWRQVDLENRCLQLGPGQNAPC